VDVAVLRRVGRHDEELAGHLEMDGQDGRGRGSGRRPRAAAGAAGRRRRPALGRTSQISSCLPRRPTPSISRPTAASAKASGVVAAQRRSASSSARRRSATRHQAAQVAGDRLDFRQFGHA
jgi:hypothetical protein